MGTKVQVDEITNVGNNTGVPTINENAEKLANEFDNVLYRDGSQSVEGDLDMDSNRLLNLPAPLTNTEPLRLADLGSLTSDATLALLNTKVSIAALIAAEGGNLVGFSQDSIDAIATTVLLKLRELRISPADFGAIPDANTSTYTGTDNQEALEAAISYAAETGGEIWIPRGHYYGFSADLIVPGNVRIVGDNERNSGLVALGSGTFTEAAVKIGGTGIIFSAGMRNISVLAGAISIPVVKAIGMQENCFIDNCIIKGSVVETLALIGWGTYNNPAGNVLSAPMHMATIRNNHIITHNSSFTKGMTTKGLDDCKIENNTITVPPFKDDGVTFQTTLGTIGIHCVDGTSKCRFIGNYVEGFERPFVGDGASSPGTVIEGFSYSAIPSVTAGATGIEIVSATGWIPFKAQYIYAYANKWDYFVKTAGSVVYSLPRTSLSVFPLQEFHLFSTKNNPSGTARIELRDDTTLQIARKVQFSNTHFDTYRTFTDGDTTPSVGDGNIFITANTAPTSITYLDDMVSGQTLRIWVDDANTTFVNGAVFLMKGGVDYTAVPNDVLTFIKKSNIIKEVGTR